MLAGGLAAGLALLPAAASVAGALVTEPPKPPPADTSASRYVEGTGFGHYSPGAALGVGLVATAVPVAAAMVASPIGGDSDFAWEAALAVGATVGLVVGPAVGLSSGGRGDRAARGVLVRVLGLGGVGVGLLGFGLAMSESDSEGSALAMMAVGAAGALVVAGSSIFDLATTPSAVEARGRPRASLGVRPGGRLAVTVTF
jgi:hypothetical protein